MECQMRNQEPYEDFEVSPPPSGLLIVSMLHDAAIRNLQEAKAYSLDGLLRECDAKVAKVIAILDEGLVRSLDFEAGGEVARNLESLYSYMGYRLFEANVKRDAAAIDEVADLFEKLKVGWDAIGLQSWTIH